MSPLEVKADSRFNWVSADACHAGPFFSARDLPVILGWPLGG